MDVQESHDAQLVASAVEELVDILKRLRQGEDSQMEVWYWFPQLVFGAGVKIKGSTLMRLVPKRLFERFLYAAMRENVAVWWDDGKELSRWPHLVFMKYGCKRKPAFYKYPSHGFWSCGPLDRGDSNGGRAPADSHKEYRV